MRAKFIETFGQEIGKCGFMLVCGARQDYKACGRVLMTGNASGKALFLQAWTSLVNAKSMVKCRFFRLSTFFCNVFFMVVNFCFKWQKKKDQKALLLEVCSWYKAMLQLWCYCCCCSWVV